VPKGNGRSSYTARSEKKRVLKEKEGKRRGRGGDVSKERSGVHRTSV